MKIGSVRVRSEWRGLTKDNSSASQQAPAVLDRLAWGDPHCIVVDRIIQSRTARLICVTTQFISSPPTLGQSRIASPRKNVTAVPVVSRPFSRRRRLLHIFPLNQKPTESDQIL